MGIFSLFFGRGDKQVTAEFSISDKEVLVRGWTNPELKQILGDFQKIYRERLPSNFSAESGAGSNDFLRVNFPHDIEPRFFCWLINYIQYPERFDSPSRKIIAAGTATITSDFLPSNQSLIGKRIIFYIPANDTQYDEVYGRVENQSYEYPFSSERWRPVNDPRLPGEITKL